ncbi:unnamed protein product [Schistocephalus solidus]|uniref:HMG box domain-containing protein n=1 Tax=Schistocephalus solidus TaxID=70667 RepID=A0A183SSE4_SCHSO|nr:unnamed protein product [Schistocephalus solidus]
MNAELRLDFAQFPALDYSSQQLSSVDACSPPNSDDEDPALADYLQYPSLLSATIPHAFSSKDFQRLVKKQSPTYSEKLRIPNSYVVFFHEILSSGELPTQGLSFGNLSKMITDRWNQLPSRERLPHSIFPENVFPVVGATSLSQDFTNKYREKASNTKQSYSRHLAAYRAKLLALSSRERPICRHSPCSKPVTSDRRWNLQYCSADCLLAHCQVTFARRYRCLQEENQIKVLQPASVTSRVSTNEVQAFATVSHFALRDCSVELRQSVSLSILSRSEPSPFSCPIVRHSLGTLATCLRLAGTAVSSRPFMLITLSFPIFLTSKSNRGFHLSASRPTACSPLYGSHASNKRVVSLLHAYLLFP